MPEEQPKQITVIVDGVKFEVDYTEADAGLLSDISRIIKGLLTILEKRAQQRA